MYTPILETERLILRTFTLADVEASFLINKDPEVVKYTGNAPMQSLDEAQKVMIEVIFPQYTQYNMGRLAVIEKKSQTIIGWCGLKYRKESGLIDLGYRYMQSAWGKGYGTEAAKCVLHHGFYDLQLPIIHAWAVLENKASYRIMEKIGMYFVGLDLCEGENAVKYEAINPNMI